MKRFLAMTLLAAVTATGFAEDWPQWMGVKRDSVWNETGLLEKFMGAPDTPENRKRFIATIPLGRLCRASDVAAAALYLASDAAEFISGVEFPVDGARTV